ncbi:hypothetical protein [Nocardia anaemiae]|uniref:hypothetical protein n=1 Tax=Nocardia anaemiae TaxID=263910 RepID=UPI0007A3B1D7|nr:hypothetical protein [Nocardia anaemiae]
MQGLNADPEVLIPTAKTGLGLQGNHEGYMKALLAVQNELQAAVKSPGGGVAIQQAMQNAWEKGNNLAQKLQDILNELLNTGVKVDASDMEAAAHVQHATAYGLDGVNSIQNDMHAGNVSLKW